MIGGGHPLLPEILGQTYLVGAKSPTFFIYFRRSASAVTPSEKSSINNNRKSITHFPMSPGCTSYVVSNPLTRGWGGGVKYARCPTFEQYTAITPKRYEIRLITKKKSHTGFRLVPTSMTLNDLERRNSPYFAFFTEFDCFAAQFRHSG